MSKVYIVSFATEDFEPFRKEMVISAMEFNLINFHSYTQADLKGTDFYKRNKHIFSYKRGYGLWLWKPYFILQSLKNVSDGDIVFYVDSGCLFINDPSELVSLALNNKSGIVAFDCNPITNRQFVKRTTFINMGCDSEVYWNSIHVIATVILFRKSDMTISFVEQWLEQCENFDSLLPQTKSHLDNNLCDFIEHREDQAILSVLVKKFEIETYRNPSKWGNFLKTEEYRAKDELVCYPYGLNNSITNYSVKPYENSRYDTVFEFNRSVLNIKPPSNKLIRIWRKLLSK